MPVLVRSGPDVAAGNAALIARGGRALDDVALPSLPTAERLLDLAAPSHVPEAASSHDQQSLFSD